MKRWAIGICIGSVLLVPVIVLTDYDLGVVLVRSAAGTIVESIPLALFLSIILLVLGKRPTSKYFNFARKIYGIIILGLLVFVAGFFIASKILEASITH
jgi:hypothetical protein